MLPLISILFPNRVAILIFRKKIMCNRSDHLLWLCTLSLMLIMGQGSSCIGNRNEGPSVREKRDVGNFSRIDVTDGIDVYLE
jgi:hypothetical protein